MTRWRYHRWHDLVAAWAAITLDRLERPAGWAWRTSLVLSARKPAGARALAAELEWFTACAFHARVVARRSATPAGEPGPP